MFTSIAEKVKDFKAKTGKNWTGGFTGDVIVKPSEEFETIAGADEGILQDQMTIPLFDIDVQYTPDKIQATEKVMKILSANGISGWLASSGNGLHFIADFMIPNSEYHRYLGLFATLTMSRDKRFKKNLEYAERISNASNFQEAQTIAKEVLEEIPNTDTSAIADIRYVAHQLLRGFAVLRSEPFWRNPNSPQVIARIV